MLVDKVVASSKASAKILNRFFTASLLFQVNFAVQSARCGICDWKNHGAVRFSENGTAVLCSGHEENFFGTTWLSLPGISCD
jgi:hypothetical protein